MHAIQPKHTKISSDELAKVLEEYNISVTQLPKISQKDTAVPEDCKKGDVLKIERKGESNEVYYRVVI